MQRADNERFVEARYRYREPNGGRSSVAHAILFFARARPPAVTSLAALRRTQRIAVGEVVADSDRGCRGAVRDGVRKSDNADDSRTDQSHPLDGDESALAFPKRPKPAKQCNRKISQTHFRHPTRQSAK